MSDAQTRISLLGAPLDSGNLGVSALSLATLYALRKRFESLQVTLFDNGRYRRREMVPVGDAVVACEQRGLWISRRFYRAESLWSLDKASRYAPGLHPNIRAMRRSAAVLDISGGDSFTDLYGPRRFRLVSDPKLITLRLGLPLILLPQTYGPFTGPASATVAEQLLRGSVQAWARDARSFERIVDLVGTTQLDDRYRLGVDVAFGLPEREPPLAVRTHVEKFMAVGDIIGINVSGLLYGDPDRARERFGLATRYDQAMLHAVQRLLNAGAERIMFIPHVYSDRESDLLAARDLAQRVAAPDRVCVLEGNLGADEVKWVISRMRWFAGARMHACIGALSSGVPATAIAYSDKFQGVFEGCGLGHRVLDARLLDATSLADGLVDAFRSLETDGQTLREHLPPILATVQRQFDSIGAIISQGDSNPKGTS